MKKKFPYFMLIAYVESVNLRCKVYNENVFNEYLFETEGKQKLNNDKKTCFLDPPCNPFTAKQL